MQVFINSTSVLMIRAGILLSKAQRKWLLPRSEWRSTSCIPSRINKLTIPGSLKSGQCEKA
jgi:hypothetical protein